MDLTPDQLEQLKSLGISTSKVPLSTSESTQTVSTLPSLGKNKLQTISSNEDKRVLKPSINPVIPLLSISGLTLLSFGGLVLFKGKETATLSPDLSGRSTQRVDNVPTQVPKSIQHYLLTSQQFFTRALSSPADQQVELVNQSILAATQATKDFPNDSRGYEQRGRLYQSLIDNNPDLIKNAIADLSSAHQLNPNSAEITRTLATLFARSGDINNTLNYLSQTVNLEPTKAQNFYDLARLQTQAGYVPQALDTYTRLLTIVADPTQKQQVTLEKESLEKLASQNIHPSEASAKEGYPTITTTPLTNNSPLLQANSGTGLIIAAPETSKDISVKSLTDSNSLSGVGILPANTSHVSITNSNLTSSSQVYLTITKGGKNQTLQVLSKSNGSFSVGLDAPINEDIEFKWWIVN